MISDRERIQTEMTAQETPQTLTDHEGSLLSLVHRLQPITAYKVAKFYQDSPVASVNKSMGQVYPMISRFSKDGLVEGHQIEDDARGTEVWRTTDKGEIALKTWLQEFKPLQLIPHDTLGTKVLSFGLLSHQERLDWVLKAKAELEKKQAELDAYHQKSDEPFQSFAHDNAVSILRARMDWLDRVLFDLVKSSAASS